MVIDVVVGVLVVVFSIYSYFRGLLRKLAGIGALVIACVGAGVAGRAIAEFAATRWNITVMPVLYIVSGVLGWVLLYIGSRIVLGYVARRLGSDKEGEPKGWNKALGALFGAMQVLLVCWFVVAIFDAIPEDTRARRLGPLHRDMEDSWFAWGTHVTSPAARLELQPLIADLSAVSESPVVLRNLQYEESVRELLEHEKVQAVMADEKLLEEFKTGRLRRFFSDRRVRDALEDSEVRDALRQAPIRDTLRRLAVQARDAQQ